MTHFDCAVPQVCVVVCPPSSSSSTTSSSTGPDRHSPLTRTVRQENAAVCTLCKLAAIGAGGAGSPLCLRRRCANTAGCASRAIFPRPYLRTQLSAGAGAASLPASQVMQSMGGGCGGGGVGGVSNRLTRSREPRSVLTDEVRLAADHRLLCLRRTESHYGRRQTRKPAFEKSRNSSFCFRKEETKNTNRDRDAAARIEAKFFQSLTYAVLNPHRLRLES